MEKKGFIFNRPDAGTASARPGAAGLKAAQGLRRACRHPWAFICCWLALLLGPSALLAQPGAKVFRAGAAVSNVTPPLGEGIVGNFGTPPPAEHIHDQLHARCLVLDDGQTKLVIVAVDNVGISREVFD